jgi:hypothetical protein
VVSEGCKAKPPIGSNYLLLQILRKIGVGASPESVEKIKKILEK